MCNGHNLRATTSPTSHQRYYSDTLPALRAKNIHRYSVTSLSQHTSTSHTIIFAIYSCPVGLMDRLCGLVVKVPGHRFRGPGSIPGATRFFLRSSGSGWGTPQPLYYICVDF
jgi:hypothetical protein